MEIYMSERLVPDPQQMILSDRIRIHKTADRSPIVGGGGQWASGGRTQREPSERPPPAEQVGRHISVLRIRIRDPVPFLPWIRDPKPDIW